MNINIKATGIELTDAIRDYVDKRLEAVVKLLQDDSASMVNVEVGKTTQHHRHGDIFKADIHITGSHRDLYVSSERSDLYAAIDEVRDEAIRRITTSKAKRLSLVRRGGKRVKDIVRGIFRRGDRGGQSGQM